MKRNGTPNDCPKILPSQKTLQQYGINEGTQAVQANKLQIYCRQTRTRNNVFIISIQVVLHVVRGGGHVSLDFARSPRMCMCVSFPREDTTISMQ